MSWRVWLTLVLAAAAVAAGLAIWKENQRLKTRGPADYRPDYILKDFTLTSLDDTGAEALTVTAPSLTRNPDTRAMDIMQPVFTFPDTNNRNWRAVAKTAWVAPKGEEVRLRGDAVVDSPDGSSTARIASQELDVFTEKGKERALSNVAVEVTQPGTIIRGLGMEALLAEDRVTFKQNVRIQYVPPAAR